MVKPKYIRPSTQYLRNKVSYVTFDNGKNERSFSLSQYVQEAVKNVIDTLSQEGRALRKGGKYPWTSNYRPETDTSPEPPVPKSAYYQSLVGVL